MATKKATTKKAARPKRPPRTIYHRFNTKRGVFHGEPDNSMREAKGFALDDEEVFTYVLAERVRQR